MPQEGLAGHDARVVVEDGHVADLSLDLLCQFEDSLTVCDVAP